MPSPSPQLLRADGMLELASPTASNVFITCSSESGDNFCYMDSVLAAIFFGTDTGPRLLASTLHSTGDTGCFALIQEFIYAPWVLLVASEGKAQMHIARESCNTLRSNFLQAGYGMLDNERHNSQRDASEFAFWCLAELQNPTLKVLGKWVHQSQDSTGQRPRRDVGTARQGEHQHASGIQRSNPR
jgi:hypothetical protein